MRIFSRPFSEFRDRARNLSAHFLRAEGALARLYQVTRAMSGSEDLGYSGFNAGCFRFQLEGVSQKHGGGENRA